MELSFRCTLFFLPLHSLFRGWIVLSWSLHWTLVIINGVKGGSDRILVGLFINDGLLEIPWWSWGDWLLCLIGCDRVWLHSFLTFIPCTECWCLKGWVSFSSGYFSLLLYCMVNPYPLPLSLSPHVSDFIIVVPLSTTSLFYFCCTHICFLWSTQRTRIWFWLAWLVLVWFILIISTIYFSLCTLNFLFK